MRQATQAQVALKRAELDKIHAKLQRALDSHLDGAIDRPAYRAEKAKFVASGPPLYLKKEGSALSD